MSIYEQLALIRHNSSIFQMDDHSQNVSSVSNESSVANEVMNHSLSERFNSIDWILVFFLLFSVALASLMGVGISFWRKHRISTKQHRTPKSCMDIFRLIQHHDHHDESTLKENGSFATDGSFTTDDDRDADVAKV